MMVDISRRGQNGSALLAGLSVVILLLGIGASLLIWGRAPVEYMEGAVSDGFALSARLVILLAGVLGVFLSRNRFPSIERQGGAFYSLHLLAIIGMMLMGTATNLIVLFIALEIFSLALYILSGFLPGQSSQHRSCHEVFSPGGVRQHIFRLRLCPTLRRRRQRSLRTNPRDALDRRRQPFASLPRYRAAAGGIWFQSEPRPVPYVDTGRIPGGANPGDSIHERGHEGRGLRRILPADDDCPSFLSRSVGRAPGEFLRSSP